MVSTLAHLVARVGTDDSQAAFAAHNLAVLAAALDGWANFHDSLNSPIHFPSWSAPRGTGFFFPAVSALAAEDDPALGQIVRGHFNGNLVARQNLDEVHAHLARHMRQNHMPCRQLHLELRVGEGFPNNRFHANGFFFCHTSYQKTSMASRCARDPGALATGKPKFVQHPLHMSTGCVMNFLKIIGIH
jgi:hypothetical protein